MSDNNEKTENLRRITKCLEKPAGPLVSVLIPTFNRPRYLSVALTSVLQQSYQNLQIIVINDGGEDVRDVIRSFNDSRLTLIDKKENRGKASALNEALARAKGKYVAYLDDDDLYYPRHIETLVNALELQTDCQAAYSDLYKVCCRVMSDGSRQVLSKVLEVSRDFDRFLMLYFNHVLHVSLMHHKDLIEKTGPYNENLSVLIDWDLTRRLAFFTDFHHVHEITGEYYNPADRCDRISVQRRKNKNEYLSNVLTIRTSRPAKPWPKVKDTSIIFVSEQPDHQQARETLTAIWRHTFYPYKVYLPVPQGNLRPFNTDMPGIVAVPVEPTASPAQRIDAALAQCDGEFIVIVPDGLPIQQFWLEDPLYALVNKPTEREGLELESSTDKLWAAVVKSDDLKHTRKNFPHLTVRESLQAAGITIRRLRPDEIPFQFDQLLEEARLAQKDGRWTEAAHIFEYIADHYQNELWMKALAAGAFYEAGNHQKAAELSRKINQQQPTVDTLLLEAKIRRQQKDFNSAVGLLKRAVHILEGKELLWI